MNKNQYKVIFNKKLGYMVAVAENITNNGHYSSDKKTGVQTEWFSHEQKMDYVHQIRLLTFSVMLATGMASFAHAGGIEADKSAPVMQQPTIHQSANGIPQINIQTPSKEGVSMNQYHQFNVDKKGAILNNSQKNIQTQIGGWIQNNPMITANEAKIIVNQVNSHNASHLNGYIEVAGRRSEVIIANPAGINVNGAGFINASGVTLTTGKPVMNNGSLEGFHVRTGQISINGQGLDSGHSDFTRILTQAAKINADIWANDLKIVTGSNNIDAAGQHTAVTDDSANRITGTAIDTANLGGMYAGKITLISTDKGVAVNHSGQIYASAGAVTIDVNGHLKNSNNIVASNEKQSDNHDASVHIKAEALSNTGKISGQDDNTIATVSLKNSGTIASANTINIHNQSATDNHGKIIADGYIKLQSQSLYNPGKLSAGQDITLQLKAHFNVDADIQAGHDLSLSTDGKIENKHTLQAGSSVHINANKISNHENAVIQSNQLTELYVQNIDNQGLINSNDQTLIHAEERLNNIGTGKIYGHHVAIATTSLVNQEGGALKKVTSGTIAARERLDIAAEDIQNREHAILSSENTLVVGRDLDADNYAINSAKTLNNASAKILANGDMTLNVDTLMNQNAHFKLSLKEVADSRKQLTAYVPDGGDWYDGNHLTGVGSEKAIYLDGKEFEDYTKFDYLQYEMQDVVDESDPALLQSKGKMTLNGTTLTNDKSQILSGSIEFAQHNINNIDAEGRHIVVQQGTSIHHYIGWNYIKTQHKSKWNALSPFTPANQVTPVKLNVMKYDTEHTAVVDAIAVQARTVKPNIELPEQSIFTINKKNPHQPVIETDPAFVNYRQWLDSDYMLTALGQHLDHTLQRLGDGYYEQKLIDEQIAKLTGKVKLNGYLTAEEQYKALMDAGILAAKTLHLKPGVALSKEQISHLTNNIVWLVKQNVTLPDGIVVQALVPQVYVVAQNDALHGKDSMIAAEQIKMNVSGNVNNNATIVGQQVTDITTQNMNNIGGMVQGAQVNIHATHDVNNIGGQLIAEDSLILNADHNLNSVTTTHQTEKHTGKSNFTAQNIARTAGLYVTSNDGNLTASAGNNLHLTATEIGSAGSVKLQANHDVVLDTVKTSRRDHGYVNNNDQIMSAYSSEVGSHIQANGDVTIQSGDSTYMRAANVNSNQGTTTVSADQHITVEEGHVTETHLLKATESDRNTWAVTTTDREAKYDNDTTVSSDITGKQVIMQAGQNMNIKGSNIISDQQTTLTAGNDIAIDASSEQYQQENDVTKKKTGVMSGDGGMSVSIGVDKDITNTKDASVIQTGSNVGSLQGDTTIVANGHYRQTGSAVSSPVGNISIQAKEVDIQAGENVSTMDYEHAHEKKAISASVSASVPIVSSVKKAISAVKTIKEVKDHRVKSMAILNSAYDGYQVGKVLAGLKDLSDLQNVFAPAVSASVTYSQQKTHESNHIHETKTVVSKVNAGSKVNIVAAGADGQSNINVIGSDVGGKGGTKLKADNKVNLLAAKQVKGEKSKNTSSGWNAGASVSYSNNGLSLGATAGANAGKGHGNGEYVTYRNTHVGDASSQTSIESGGATNLKGAEVTGKGVDITASELNVESLQDTSVYGSKQRNVSAQVTAGYGVSASGSYGESKVDADYAAVTEQSGVMAGDDGYHINVAGNTDLKGAIITSTQTAEATGHNSLTTGTLTHSDVKNHANYKGTGLGVDGGAALGGGESPKEIGGMKLTEIGNNVTYQDPVSKKTTTIGSTSGNISVGIGYDSKDDKTVTQSGVNTANITITDKEKQLQLTHKTAEQTIADIHTESTTDNYAEKAGYLKNNFNKEKVLKELNLQVKVTKEFSKNSRNLVDGYVLSKQETLREDIKKAKTEEEKTKLYAEIYKLQYQKRFAEALISVISGSPGAAVTLLTLQAANTKMREASLANSRLFTGIKDPVTGKIYSNVSYDSGYFDGVKLGGARLSFDASCGHEGERCTEGQDGLFTYINNNNSKFKTLTDAIDPDKNKDAKEMYGTAGGLQGDHGTFLGVPYDKGGLFDTVIEAFAGTHDFGGGQVWGWYDENGNTTRGRFNDDNHDSVLSDITSGVAIPVTAPFAIADLISPDMLQLIIKLTGH